MLYKITKHSLYLKYICLVNYCCYLLSQLPLFSISLNQYTCDDYINFKNYTGITVLEIGY